MPNDSITPAPSSMAAPAAISPPELAKTLESHKPPQLAQIISQFRSGGNVVDHLQSGDATMPFASPLQRFSNELKLRAHELTTAEARQQGVILKDEIYLGMRVIDNNIIRSLPTYVRHLEKSNRQLAFISVDSASSNTALEEWFTKLVRYNGWQDPIYQAVDSSETHGYGVVQVVDNEASSSGFRIDYVANADFIFPLSMENLQTSLFVMRRYTLNALELDHYATAYSFDPDRYKELKERVAAGTANATTVIYHCFSKVKGQVVCCWLADSGTLLLRDWYEFFDGRRPRALPDGTPSDEVVATEYPFFMLRNELTCRKRVLDLRGRGAKDAANQAGQTSLVMALVNGLNRSSGLYVAKKEAGGSTSTVELELSHGKLVNTPVEFYTPPAPPTAMLSVAQYLNVAASSQAGQVDYAAQNRNDTRKTATEVQAALNESEQFSSIDTLLFSRFCTDVYSYIYYRVRYNVLRGTLRCDNMAVIQALQLEYNIRAAGDIDFVEREQKIQRMMQFWPVISGNQQLAAVFLEELLNLAFPNEAPRLIQAARGPDRAALTNGLVGILKEVIPLVPPGAIDNDHMAQIQQLLNAAQPQPNTPAGPAQGDMGVGMMEGMQ